MPRSDPHSYFDDAQPRVKHVVLDWTVDFQRKVITGSATLIFAAPGSGQLDLDTRGLDVHTAHALAAHETQVQFVLHPEEPVIGQRLSVQLPHDTTQLRLNYTTSPDASALQWLEPSQTAGKQHPYLFTQCQAIHARSVVPLQDSPRARVTYKASVRVPAPLAAVMSAAPVSHTSAHEGTRVFEFDMPQPIPPYLLALAVGHIESRELCGRSRIWSEPEVVERAAYEFAEMEKILSEAEALFGPYEWQRYDMLVLPPSFPYGGMENPRITFLTPFVLAGDRSLVDLVYHELAHSWTGNLVTNSNMEHFWLNEGFTTYAERRILEAIAGEEASTIAWAVGQHDLDESVARFAADSDLTKLRTQMNGVDPDEAFSSIPYEKGSRFVVVLERAVGRPRFDEFLKAYMQHFRFTSIATEEFLEFLERELPGVAARVGAHEWLYEKGMPSNAPVFRSAKLEEITSLAERWHAGARPTSEQIASWGPDIVLVFLQHLPRQLSTDELAWLDQTFSLNSSKNYEILVEWLTIAAGSNYSPVFAELRTALPSIGRMKYLRPLFNALGRHEQTRQLACEIYRDARIGYHALSRRVVEAIMEKW
jgi:leukotriene-A4 hydrolase